MKREENPWRAKSDGFALLVLSALLQRSRNVIKVKYRVYIRECRYFRHKCLLNAIKQKKKSLRIKNISWGRLHNEELHNLYASTIIIRVFKSRRMRYVGRVARMGEMRDAYNILVGKPKSKRPLGRTGLGWEDNIWMDLREIEWKVVD
jgi:hypothetical protein